MQSLVRKSSFSKAQQGLMKTAPGRHLDNNNNNNNNNNIAEMAVFNVAGYLRGKAPRWPVITASPRGQYSK